jgi:UDP-glucose 4-epimerase
MNILLTGAFGNIGTSTLKELTKRGHHIRCFDMQNRTNEKTARKFGDAIETMWGDLRNPADLRAAVKGQDVVIHLAFVIPKLSATGIQSEEQPEWARAINVGGTRNLLDAMQSEAPDARMIFISSIHVYGPTQDLPAPRRVSENVHPIEHYARHKIECEQMVKNAGMPWLILRLAAAMPIRLIIDTGMFDVPLNNRIEFVHSRDVGLAIANALQTEAAWGKTLLIGGGQSCQMRYRDMMNDILKAVGIGKMPEEAFTTKPFAVDWMDTDESQRLLQYQTRTLDHYVKDTRRKLSWRIPFIKLFRGTIRRKLLKQSPYLPINKTHKGVPSTQTTR